MTERMFFDPDGMTDGQLMAGLRRAREMNDLGYVVAFRDELRDRWSSDMENDGWSAIDREVLR